MSGYTETYSCEKQLLYEIEAPGVLYLTVDHDGPVYVDFKHKLRLDLCLAVNNGQFKDTSDLTKTLHVSLTKKPLLVQEKIGPGKAAPLEKRLRTSPVVTQEVTLPNSVSPAQAISHRATSEVYKNLPVGNGDLTQELKPSSSRSSPSVLTLAKSAKPKTEINSVGRSFSHLRKRLGTSLSEEESKASVPLSHNTKNLSKTTEPEINATCSSETAGLSVKRQKTVTPTQEQKPVSVARSASDTLKTVPATEMSSPQENEDEKYTGSQDSPCSGLEMLDKKSEQRKFQNQLQRSNERQMKANESVKPLPPAVNKNLALQRMTAERERQALLKLKKSKKTSVVLTRWQLDRLMMRSKNRNHVSGEASQSPKDYSTSTPVAQETFRSSSENKEQGKTSTGTVQTPVQCKYCGQEFSSQKAFDKHRKFTHFMYHLCLKCNAAFPYRAYLQVHLKYHNVKDHSLPYKCDDCDFESPTLSNLKRHALIHTEEHCYKCCRCSETFPNHDMLMQHLTKHREKGLIRCSCCSQLFSSRMALADHKLSVRKLKCGLCKQVFPTIASRLLHYKSEHRDTILRCPFCDRMYSTQRELDKHKVEHTRSRKKCPICGKLVSRLKGHMRSHKSVEDMPESELFMCDQCPRKFKTASELKGHAQIHAPEKTKCHLCPASFTRRDYLTRHLSNVHSNFMPYQCEICGKQCKQKANLEVHMRIHSSVKKFPCTFCSQAFNYKSSLQGHLRSKHSLELTPGTDISSIGKSTSTSSEASASFSDLPFHSKPVEILNPVNQALSESSSSTDKPSPSSATCAPTTGNGMSNGVKPMFDDSRSSFSMDLSEL